jgi:hypothetical protein
MRGKARNSRTAKSTSREVSCEGQMRRESQKLTDCKEHAEGGELRGADEGKSQKLTSCEEHTEGGERCKGQMRGKSETHGLRRARRGR